MVNMQYLKDRVSWAINTIKEDKRVGKGITDAELSKLLGITENTLITYRNGQGTLKGSAIQGLVTHFNFNPLWLHKGSGEPFPGARHRYPDVCGPEDKVVAIEENEIKGEFVYIPQMTGKISAGGGLIPDNRVDLKVAFRKDWLKRKGDPSRMLLVKVSGDSMEPTLFSGDLVLIDQGRNYVDPSGGIYAIAVHNEIMIKRIHIVFPDGKVRIISDNPRYDPMEVETEKVVINGKVIWFGREIER